MTAALLHYAVNEIYQTYGDHVSVWDKANPYIARMNDLVP